MVTKLLQGLNESQQQAVSSPLGSTLVLAGAGSGKTKVLVSRIAWLIKQHQIQPNAILAVTFTNKAAAEMKTRLAALLDISISGLWVGTFHSLCHRLVLQHYREANLPAQFAILDSDDQLRLIKRIIIGLNLNVELWPAKQAQNFINSNKDNGIRPNNMEDLQKEPQRTLGNIYTAYEQARQASNALDFADLLLTAYELLYRKPELRTYYQQRFQAVLVDEFQDTNAIQYAWIKLLIGEYSTVMAVGDDDQSIYGWRGAKLENIQKFSQDFPSTNVIRLEQNYRSTANILQAANALIGNNKMRMGKKLWTAGDIGAKIKIYGAVNELDEARFVIECIRKKVTTQTYQPHAIAILYRSNVQSRVFEEALLHAKLAYRIHGGVRFFERAEIKDALAYLRLILNPHDDYSFERVLNFPARGIGEKTLTALKELAAAKHISLWSAAKIITPITRALVQFICLIEQLQCKAISVSLDDQISEVIQHSGLY